MMLLTFGVDKRQPFDLMLFVNYYSHYSKRFKSDILIYFIAFVMQILTMTCKIINVSYFILLAFSLPLLLE